ncbi:hypothetical protein [Cellulomonas fimi]|uniref:Uncharacterized protein n=1 Tax=Cellulomonas fimi TaxID=1708 RepID=A0A7Y0QIN2_CELFI|nr:hypothetical protein [Cellulomonas fimi]NMR21074.1 hypothetical protein [Cellulomonas fimi]
MSTSEIIGLVAVALAVLVAAADLRRPAAQQRAATTFARMVDLAPTSAMHDDVLHRVRARSLAGLGGWAVGAAIAIDRPARHFRQTLWPSTPAPAAATGRAAGATR